MDEAAAAYVPVQTTVWMPVTCRGRPPRRGEWLEVMGFSTAVSVGGRAVCSVKGSNEPAEPHRVLLLRQRPRPSSTPSDLPASTRPVLGIATGAFEAVPQSWSPLSDNQERLWYVQTVVAGSAYVASVVTGVTEVGSNMLVCGQVEHRAAILTMSR